MQTIHINATDAWLHVLKTIKEKGDAVYLKGTETLEVKNNSVAFDMRYPFIQHPKRFCNWKFLGCEIEAICSGDNRVENLAKYNSNIAQFSDDGYIFNGAYGPAFNDQVMYVVNNLLNDPTSRQAVIVIWKSNPQFSKDIRCTLTLQFMIRGGFMHTFVNMRSSDAIWGLTYDFPVFVFMSLRILTMLNEQIKKRTTTEFIPGIQNSYSLGFLYWNGASSHVYDRHYSLMDDVLNFSQKNPQGHHLNMDRSINHAMMDDWIKCVAYYKGLQGEGETQ